MWFCKNKGPPFWALELKSLLNQLLTKMEAIRMTLDDVLAKVTAEKDVVDAIGLVVDQIIAQDTDIAAKLRALIAGGGVIDPAKLQAVADQLDANTTKLSTKKDEVVQAIVDNTVAEP